MMRVMGPFATRVPMECDACEGTGEKVRAQDWCKKCSGKKVVTEKKRVEFSIERGIMPGEKIVLRNEGDETVCLLLKPFWYCESHQRKDFLR